MRQVEIGTLGTIGWCGATFLNGLSHTLRPADCFLGVLPMDRYINLCFMNEKDEEHFFQKKICHSHMNLYREAIGRCCWPQCPYPSDTKLETHHIWPIKKGGTDDFVNYIVLCRRCHAHHRLHGLYQEKSIEVLTYKFYQEKLLLGRCSDEMRNEEYRQFLSKILRERNANEVSNVQ